MVGIAPPVLVLSELNVILSILGNCSISLALGLF
jgi:hypothetical protein